MSRVYTFAALLSLVSLGLAPTHAEKPNVLFIAMDDLNDWIGCMGGHPQTITPNLDRLAASGTLFNNAHCPAPACNPSRTSIFTGRAPNRSGMYDNRQKMREILPNATLLPKYFHNHGYNAAGAGKLLHYFIDAESWDDYFPAKETERPLPRTFYPKTRPVNLPRGGPWQYVETDWAALDVTDEEFGGDWLVSDWIGKRLSKTSDQPFFLACGIYRPHEPWFVPKKYFEPFPLDEVQLPKGYKEDDLDDLPKSGQRLGPNRYFAHIQEHGQWKQGVQAYLASIHFADAMLGRVLDALENGPNANNTIVVLWSDHGWHLGEKQHWQKYTAWRACTRVPLIIRVPEKLSNKLPGGTKATTVCAQPVNLVSLFPTLIELCELPAKADNDGPSLLPLLQDPMLENGTSWSHTSVTCLGTPGSFGLSTATHRYIHYADGGEELYETATDPYEWNNLAVSKSSASLLDQLRKLGPGPDDFAPKIKASVQSLGKLRWNPIDADPAPPSKPDGGTFEVYFINNREKAVELFWMRPNGKTKSYGQIGSGAQRSQQTRPGAVWMIADAESKNELGYFTVGDRTARAVVPK